MSESLNVTKPEELPGRLVEGWKHRDAGAIADLFHESGTMVLPGVFCNGRQAVQDFFTDAFQNQYRDSQVTGTAIEMQLINSEALVLLTEGGVMYGDETEVAAENAIRASWLVQKDGAGAWKLLSYVNTPR